MAKCLKPKASKRLMSQTNKSKIVFQTIRVPFLILTPICVFLGVSIALYHQAPIAIYSLVLALIGAMLAHISVNTLNEYLDYKSGLDLNTVRTPFSGGSGALPQNPSVLGVVLIVGLLSLLLTILIGVYFIIEFGMSILPIGVFGVLLVVSYTSWINKLPFLCLIAPGLGFGLFVVGTQYVLVGEYYQLTWLLVLIPFFLINNLLLLNQYPDIDADKQSGRNHFPIAFGIKASNFVYGLFALTTFSLIIIYSLFGVIPKLCLVAVLPMPLSLIVLSGMIKHGKQIGIETQYLAMNVVLTLLTPLLLGLTIFYSANT